MTPQKLAQVFRHRASIIQSAAETLSLQFGDGSCEMPSSLAAAGELTGIAERLEVLPAHAPDFQIEHAILGR